MNVPQFGRSETPGRAGYIQSLRAVAAVLVAASHIAKEALQEGSADPYHLLRALESFQFGVDIFFVLSGFIIVWVTYGRPSGAGPAAEFFKKRLIRVVPLYWLFTFLLVAPLLLARHSVHHATFSAPYLVASLFFVPWPRPTDGFVEPLLGLGWTLNYEMMFYLVFGTLIAAKVRRPVAALAILLSMAFLAGLRLEQSAPQVWYWTRSSILEFVFGAGIALSALEQRFSIAPATACLLLLSAGTLWFGAYAIVDVANPVPNVRGLLWGPAAGAIVGSIAMCPRLAAWFEFGGKDGLMQRIGDASYSLYLSHMFVVRLATLAIGRLIGGPGTIVYVVLTLCLCVLASLVIFRFVEKPLIGLARADLLRRPARA